MINEASIVIYEDTNELRYHNITSQIIKGRKNVDFLSSLLQIVSTNRYNDFRFNRWFFEKFYLKKGSP